MKTLLPFLLFIVLDFYLLPLLISNTGMAMLLLLAVMPLLCFVCSIIYGVKHAFNWLYPLLVIILFLPTIFIFYNYTAWVYAVAYGVIALVGNAIGALIRKTIL